jgi:serine/threonine-protein kinase
MVALHLKKHGGDPEKSLAAIPAGHSTRDRLAGLGDRQIDASLQFVASGPTEPDVDSTTSFSIGSATSDGQRFRVLRPHARGGLGAVFVAMDNELNREVALKQILDHHADDPTSRHRFVIEAEITGGLEHPGIVPVYGLGTYADGRPFYAMRFIQGDSLKGAIERFHGASVGSAVRAGEQGRLAWKTVRRADPTGLELRKLLRRFTDVCNALEYAHARGVLHRDLKPGNIIVGKYGETLVVDWGLAKALGHADPASSERTLLPSSASGSAETLPGSAVGTPAYMSPEQARGDLEALGPWSDVYSLGATLYCLLTGRPPYEGDDIGTILRHVQNGEFPPPRQLNPTIDRALEAVCLKAMAPKPEDRYESCRALAGDIERWLADEPVSARREPLRERAWRWVRKHPIPASAVAAALLVGLAAALYGLRRERAFATGLAAANTAIDQQRARAEEREKQAIDAVRRFRDAVADNPALKNNPALEDLRKTLLKEPLAFFRSLREQLHADNDTRPEALARLADAAFELGRLTGDIGDRQDAIAVHLEALAIRDRLARENPTVVEFQNGLAESYDNIGMLQRETGQPQAALKSYERALGIREWIARENPMVTEFQNGLALSQHNIGMLQRQTGQPGAALKSYERAMAILERLGRENPAATIYQNNLAQICGNVGNIQSETGEPEAALKSYQLALATLERLARDHPTEVAFQHGLAQTHESIGMIEGETGRPVAALKSHQRALAILQRLALENPAVTFHQNHLAHVYGNVGNMQRQMGQPEAALNSYGQALAIEERLARENPTVVQFQNGLAQGHGSIGNIQREIGQRQAALKSYEHALGIFERLAREDPQSPDYARDLGGTLQNIAVIDLDARRFAEARDRLRQAITSQKRALAANPTQPVYRQYLMSHLMLLSNAAHALGRDDERAEAERELAELRASDARFTALDAHLNAVSSGATLKDNSQRLAMAQRAYDIGRHALAAQLWGEALESDPALARDRLTQRAYNAACAAALAATGQGRAETALDGAARAKLRQQARAWLNSELVAWSSLVQSGTTQARPAVAQTLRHWQQDTDLAGVRDRGALAKLPERERQKWQALWTSVEELRRRAEAGSDASRAPESGELPADPFTR